MPPTKEKLDHKHFYADYMSDLCARYKRLNAKHPNRPTFKEIEREVK